MSDKRRKSGQHRFVMAIVALCALLVLGACSSSSKKASTTPTSSTGSSASSGGPPLPGGGSLAPVRDSILAGIDGINASGGIKGRQIHPIVCDDQNQANLDAECAQEAVSGHVVASIAFSGTTFTTMGTLFQQAGIANIGGVAAGAEATSPISFPFVSGVPGEFAGMAEALAAAGAKNVSLIYPSDLGAASAALSGYFKQGAAVAHVSIAHLVGVPISTSDFGPAAATAVSGADGVAAYMPGESQVTVMKAIRAASSSVKVAAGTFSLLPPQIQALGATGNAVSVVGLGAQPTSDVPAAQAFRADMAKYYPSDALSDQELAGWVAVWLFQQVAEGLPQITTSAVMNAMNHLQNQNMDGFVPPLTTTQPCTTCGPLTRLFNPTVTFLTLNNGQLVQNDPGVFHNVFTGATVNA
jgi:ABC-type branched-subunit amino acid transport system substrate-binding protein